RRASSWSSGDSRNGSDSAALAAVVSRASSSRSCSRRAAARIARQESCVGVGIGIGSMSRRHTGGGKTSVQLALEDLPGRSARELVVEDDLARNLVAGELRSDRLL